MMKETSSCRILENHSYPNRDFHVDIHGYPLLCRRLQKFQFPWVKTEPDVTATKDLEFARATFFALLFWPWYADCSAGPGRDWESKQNCFRLCGTLCYFVILKCSFIHYGTDLGIHTTWIPNIWPLLINDLGAPKRQRSCLLFLLNEINRFCPVSCQHILDHFGYIFFGIFVVSHFHHFPCGVFISNQMGDPGRTSSGQTWGKCFAALEVPLLTV